LDKESESGRVDAVRDVYDGLYLLITLLLDEDGWIRGLGVMVGFD